MKKRMFKKILKKANFLALYNHNLEYMNLGYSGSWPYLAMIAGSLRKCDGNDYEAQWAALSKAERALRIKR